MRSFRSSESLWQASLVALTLALACGRSEAATFLVAGQPSPAYGQTVYYHTATLLQNGKILLAGGNTSTTPVPTAGNAQALASLYDPTNGTWTNTGSMNSARSGHTATLLPNGKVLVVGGTSATTSTAELYDPAAGVWTLTPAMASGVARQTGHTATLLSSGKVLVAGGASAFSSATYTNKAELYNPTTNTWTATAGNLNTARGCHTATALPTGDVIIIGGTNGSRIAMPELYSASAGTFAIKTYMGNARASHTATLLGNGNVLVACGDVADTTAGHDSELYNPTGNSWSYTGSSGLSSHLGHTASLLPNGLLLAAGGANVSGTTIFGQSSIYKPSTGTWSVGPTMVYARVYHTATLAPNGNVVVLGGLGTIATLVGAAEAYDGSKATPTSANAMVTARMGHITHLLPNGLVLADGGSSEGVTPVTTSELYNPATATWGGSANMLNGRYLHASVQLAVAEGTWGSHSGDIMAIGGLQWPAGQNLDAYANTEIYLTSSSGTWAASTWKPGPSLNQARSSFTATALGNGMVLVAGGNSASNGSGVLNTSEVFNPLTGAWSYTANPMNHARYGHTATLLKNGTVLVTGGDAHSGYLYATEIYHPVTQTWTATTGALNTARIFHTTTLLPDGKVLAAGGCDPYTFALLDSCELFDPATGLWTKTANLNVARDDHTATLLPNGRVLAAGGLQVNFDGSTGSSNTGEIFDSATAAWNATNGRLIASFQHAATLLPSGKVLLSGGGSNSTGYASGTCDFCDAGLNSATQPTLTTVTTPVFAGQAFVATGSNFCGNSESTGGCTNQSATNYPLLVLRSLANEQMQFLPGNPATPWSSTSFNCANVASMPRGYALAYVSTNGVPSNLSLFQFQNSAPTAVTLSNTVVPEKQWPPCLVGTLTATDPDTTDLFTYALVPGLGSADNAKFTISGNTLYTAASLDYATQTTCAIRVRATDAAGAWIETAFTLTVRHTAILVKGLSYGQFVEGAPRQDVGPLTTVVGGTTVVGNYDLSWYSPGTPDNNAFVLQGPELLTNQTTSFSTKNVFSIMLDDGSNNVQQQMYIYVQRSSGISLVPCRVNERQSLGTAVGSLSNNPNPTDSYTYTLVNSAQYPDNNSFTMSGTTLNTAAVLTYATKSIYTIEVQSYDNTSPRTGQTYQQTLTVYVNFVNQPTTGIRLNGSASGVTFNDDQPLTAIIGTFTAVDADLGENFAFSLVSGTGSADNYKFTVANGCQLQPAVILDYATQSIYNIRVQTTDPGDSTITVQQAFTITLFKSGAWPTAIALTNNAVLDQSPVGCLVGTFCTECADDGSGGAPTFTYALAAGGADNAAFSIVGNQLLTASIPNYYTQSTYHIKVQTTDSNVLNPWPPYNPLVQDFIINVVLTPTSTLRLQVLVPGETAAPGTPSGKTGTPVAQAPGTEIYVVVNAVDANWNVLNCITDTVQMTCSDPDGTVYASPAALSKGTHRFRVDLETTGSTTVTATDLTNSLATPCTSAAVPVLGPAAKLVFAQQPSNTLLNVRIKPAVTVLVQDAFGNTVTTADFAVRLGIGTNPGGGTLSGAQVVASVGGMATFNALSINTTGTGYTLAASAVGVTGGTTSSPFNITTVPTWSAAGSLNTARDSHTATLLQSGKVLVAGGASGSSQVLASAELYDPATNTWSVAASLATARCQHTATLLPNGKVLVAGGYNSTGYSLVAAELYDPGTNTWSTVGSLATARASHTATLLPNGLVLVAGGWTNSGGATASAELYDPSTNAWRAAGTLTAACSSHTATLLPSGKVLVTGGRNGGGSPLAGTELYDPGTNMWSTAASLTTSRYGHTATLLPSGFLLVAGGYNGSYLASTELYNPGTNTWSAAGTVATARSYHTATLLPDGDVLVTGGRSTSSGYVAGAERYVVWTNTWYGAGSFATACSGHTATLLPSGTVLAAGGYSGTLLASAELCNWGLGYLDSWRPVISSATSPLAFNAKLVLSGSAFTGLSEASGGDGCQSSATNYPLVQLQSQVNGQTAFLLADPASSWSNTTFTSVPVNNFPTGYVSVTVFTNGIPSFSQTIFVLLPSARLQILAPGEIAAPGTPSGKTGTPIAQAAGTPFNVTVNAVDANWNLVNNIADTVTITSSDAMAVVPSNVALVNGTMTFSVTLNTAGTATLTATDSTDNTKAPNISASITVNPGLAAKLAFRQQPTNSMSGASVTPAVAVLVQDANGNTVTTDTSTVNVLIGTNPGGGMLSGAQTVTAVNGVATFTTLSIDNAGIGYTLTASDGALTGTTSTQFNITAAKLIFGQQPTNTTSGASINPAVTVLVQDVNGHTVTTDTSYVTLMIGTNPGGGTLSGTRTVAAVGGVATFTTLSIDKTGTGYTLAASDGALKGTTSGLFNVATGAAASIALCNSPSTVGPVGVTVATPPSYLVADAAGNPVSGVLTTFTVSNGGSVTPASITTNASGIASVTAWTLSMAAGTNTLTAAASGVGTPVAVTVIGTATLWSAAGNLANVRFDHTSTLLTNGRVLVAGGWGTNFLSSAELYDPGTNTWNAAGAFVNGRSEHTATLLLSGKVLVAGGYNGGCLASAELYDSGSNTWSVVGSLAIARASHTATLLPGGKVLVTGGQGIDALSVVYLNSAELYDPVTNTWSAAGELATPRTGHTATLLPSGKVLVAGGFDGSRGLTSAELYDPKTNTWSTAGSLVTLRYDHTASLLSNGKVLVAGGYGGWYSTELYDPATDSWSAAGSLTTARAYHTATLLPSGKVLASGGYNGSYLASAEQYDPETNTWSAAGSLANARAYHTATLLPTGKMVVAAGTGNGASALGSAELYDPGTPTWSATGSLATARRYHTATLLPSGQVLVAGGEHSAQNALASAELYDPQTKTWGAAGSLVAAREQHTATLLPSGLVLVAAGYDITYSFTASAELYDPGTNKWSAAGSLATARVYHTATLLPNGQVLVAGGWDGGGPVSAERYDPTTNTWSAAGSPVNARIYHTATLLPSGLVLVAGGAGLLSTELYDPRKNTWNTAGSLAKARFNHTATLLPNGKVLVAGGEDSNGHALASAEVYDPGTNLWSAAGSLVTARYSHTATLLSSGKVLVAGGIGSSNLASTEVYDPATNTWSGAGSLATARCLHTATLLPSGLVLAAAGRDINYNALASAEVYDPGLGFLDSWRPVISSATSPLPFNAELVLGGSAFTGLSEASGGNGCQNSSTNYPLVQLQSLVNEQSAFLLSDPALSWSATAFTSVPVNNFPPGYALATVFTNGIPSTSQVILISPFGPAAQLAFGQQPTNTVAGNSITPALTVLVQDAYGNTVATDTSNVSLMIGTNPGGGTLSGAMTVAAVNGVATFNTLSIDKAGAGYTLAASDGALTGTTSSPFNILPPPAAITLHNTPSTSGTFSTALATEPAFIVTDVNSNPVPNASVTFSVDYGGTVAPASVTTDANGIAAVQNWILGPTVGTNTLSATVSGTTITTQVAAMGMPPAVVWVDAAYSSGSSGPHTWLVDAFSSVNSGITAVAANGVVHVADGTYAEDAVINKVLTLYGNVNTGAVQSLAFGAGVNAAVVQPGTDTTVGRLNCLNTLSLANGGTLNIRVHGFTTAGTDYDQVYSSGGTLYLGTNAALVLDVSAMDGTTWGTVTVAAFNRPVTGTFDSITIQNNPYNYQAAVSYGNAVTVTLKPAASDSGRTPANGATVYTSSPAFSWATMNGMTSCDILITDVASGTQVTYESTPANNYTCCGLLVPGSYAWAVAGKNTSGQMGAWSTPFTFVIPTLAAPSSGFSPANGQTVSSSDGTIINWNAPPDAGSYDLWVLSDTGIQVVWASGIQPPYQVPFSLSSGNYSWRVRTWSQTYPGLVSAWTSPALTFTVPDLVAPSNLQTSGQLGSPTFSWDPVSAATGGYDLWVVNSTTGVQMVYLNGIGTGTASYTLDFPLQPGGYTWYVRSRTNGGVISAWSSQTFVVATVAVPSAPFSPADGSTSQTAAPQFSWTSDPSATGGYDLWIWSSTTGLQVDFETGLTAPCVSPAIFVAGSYAWFVRARSSGGVVSAWAGPMTFVVPLLSAPSSAFNPADRSTTASSQPNFSWNDTGATSYDIQVLQNGTQVTYCDGIQAPSWLNPFNLANGTYTWRVRSRSGSGLVSVWSGVQTFQVLGLPVPTGTFGVTPLGSSNPEFSWTSAGGGYTYDVYVLKSTYTAVYYHPGVTDPYTPGVTLPSGNYVWNVRTRDPASGNVSAWVGWMAFSVQ